MKVHIFVAEVPKDSNLNFFKLLDSTTNVQEIRWTRNMLNDTIC